MASLTALGETSVSKLFVSCDLTGATAFKQREEDGWQKVFLSFYREFPQMVFESQKDCQTTGLQFRLWKAIGDELVFEVDVACEKDVYQGVRTWLHALDRYERESLAEFKLTLKGGSFIATFPGPDSRSSIPRHPESEQSDESVVLLNDKALAVEDHSKYLYDYYGPSIDTGFRVINKSVDRHFTMSVEVAWCVAHTEVANGRGDEEGPQDLVFLGQHELKGVWSSRPYPVFAIDRHATDGVNRAIAKLDSSGLDPNLVTRACMACFRDESWPFGLYLPDSDTEDLQTVPKDAMAELRTHAENSDIWVELDGDEVLTTELPLGDQTLRPSSPQPSA